jgi:protein-S-isoprenylcysteine O-methyltransferase Ste14
MLEHDHSVQVKPPGFWGTRYAIGLIVIGAVAGYFLLTEHLAHVVGALPFLLLLACPTLLTLLMFPILLVMYARLAITQEAQMRKRFGAKFDAYATRTARFLPSWRQQTPVV